jgi:hypothetical protein
LIGLLSAEAEEEAQMMQAGEAEAAEFVRHCQALVVAVLLNHLFCWKYKLIIL